MGRTALPVQMDVTRLDQIRSAVREGVRRYGRIDVLVNNAGVGAPSPAERVTEKDFDETVAVNLKATFFVSQAVAKVMIRQRRGRIVNVGSQAGTVALPTESVYCMTKAGIAHLTKCLALEWARHGITVNAVAPTFVETPGTRKWLDDRAFRASVVRRNPAGPGRRTGGRGRTGGVPLLEQGLAHHRRHPDDRWRLDHPVRHRGRARASAPWNGPPAPRWRTRWRGPGSQPRRSCTRTSARSPSGTPGVVMARCST